MFDTMTLTKIVGGFCGTFLVFLLGNWVGETIYHVGGGHGGEIEQAYSIEVPEGEGGEEEGGGEPAFEEVFASADAGAGERVFSKCRSCHNLDGSNAVGPHLDGVVGREVATVSGFSYSGALAENFDTWSPENLNVFLEDPQGSASGTAMAFNGLPSVEDRANLIAYLETTGG
jgi:cytochrome c